MKLYKIQQLIELLREYNTFFFAGNDKPCIDLIEDASQHKIDIINTFVQDLADDSYIDDIKDFIDIELS